MFKVDRGALKIAIKALNNSGFLKEEVDPKGTNVDLLAENFMLGVEGIPSELDKELPVVVADMYNILYQQFQAQKTGETETMIDDNTDVVEVIERAREEEKVETEKAEKKPKKEKKVIVKQKAVTVEKKPGVERDEYGFSIKTKFHKFVQTIKENPGITMSEIKKADWNDKGLVYYVLTKKLRDRKVIRKEGEKLYLV